MPSVDHPCSATAPRVSSAVIARPRPRPRAPAATVIPVRTGAPDSSGSQHPMPSRPPSLPRTPTQRWPGRAKGRPSVRALCSSRKATSSSRRPASSSCRPTSAGGGGGFSVDMNSHRPCSSASSPPTPSAVRGSEMPAAPFARARASHGPKAGEATSSSSTATPSGPTIRPLASSPCSMRLMPWVWVGRTKATAHAGPRRSASAGCVSCGAASARTTGEPPVHSARWSMVISWGLIR